ncbi:MAG: ferritin [Planctomycetes bacterium]|nr:ferritin [Planctomycetota bacterium]
MSMLISEEMTRKLNHQVTEEFSAAHTYQAMRCAFNAMGLKIMAQRFQAQADEERGHGMKLLNYIMDVGAAVELEAIPKPSADVGSPMAILKGALQAELAVTKQYNELMAFAEGEKDYATRSFLQWFVNEQVEEVSSMSDLLHLAEMAKGNMLQVEMRVRHAMMGK